MTKDFEPRKRVLDTAKNIITGERRNFYGDAEDEFTRIAAGWSALLHTKVSPRKVALMMVWLKVCREDFQHKEDNLIDICGYAALANGMDEDLHDGDQLQLQRTITNPYHPAFESTTS